MPEVVVSQYAVAVEVFDVGDHEQGGCLPAQDYRSLSRVSLYGSGF